MRFIGIDVSAKTLSVVIRRGNKVGKVKEYENTPAGFTKLISYVNPHKHQLRVCLEATGTYHFDISVKLYDTCNVELMVVNPRIARRFADSLNLHDKTDQVDAAVLAEYAERMPFVPWVKPKQAHIKLRAFSRRIAAVTSLRAQAKCQLHAHESSVEYSDKVILKSIKKTIQFFDKQVAELEAHAIMFIRSEPELEKFYELMLGVKGIAATSAIQLLGELLVLDEEMDHRQWVKHAGLNPRMYQSGTSVNKKPRISKAGNRHLRKALYMPALSAANHDPYVRGYYQHLIEDRGLKKMQALCAVMRKLLHAIHGMLKKGERFDNTRFFHSPLNKKIETELQQAA